jgi:hypothetical protein
LFFILGAAASLLRSDLSIPEPIGKALSIYLMIAIGLKGGVQLAGTGVSIELVVAAAAGLALSFLLPLPVFFMLRGAGKLDAVNAAAVAAHYGSVSVVTFVAGSEFLATAGLAASGYMVAVLALMETPAIIVGLLLAQRYGAVQRPSGAGLLHETLLNGSVVLLIGSLAIGAIIGTQGYTQIAPVFDGAFRGILCLFLLDMGLIAARRLRESKALTPRLIALGVGFAFVNGLLGLGLGFTVGLGAGDAAALAILAASASYIAVPAAMRLALPQADAGLSLGMSLAVTFPFNILVNIPLLSALAGAFGTA